MSNPLIKSKTQAQPQQHDMNALFDQFKADPMKYLTGMDIPHDMSNPQQIVRYLADKGKIPPFLQGRVNAMLGRK